MPIDTIKSLPRVTKVLLIINLALFGLAYAMPSLNQTLALHYFESPLFRWYQVVSHVFMHSGLTHLLFNMYALVIFGAHVERQLGERNFLYLYFLAALGAFVLHMVITKFQLSGVPIDVIEMVKTEGVDLIASGRNWADENLGQINAQFNGAMVGASGALMGVLAAFAYIYPNTELSLMFIPVPIKAKYFVPILIMVDLFLGVRNFEWDNIAHFAHIGGAVCGLIFMFVLDKRRR